MNLNRYIYLIKKVKAKNEDKKDNVKAANISKNDASYDSITRPGASNTPDPIIVGIDINIDNRIDSYLV